MLLIALVNQGGCSNPIKMSNNLIEQIKSERRWFFKAQLIYFYHHAQQLEFGSEKNKGWKLTDTAQALGFSIGHISESLKLVREYKEDEIGTMTRDEALEKLRDKNGRS